MMMQKKNVVFFRVCVFCCCFFFFFFFFGKFWTKCAIVLILQVSRTAGMYFREKQY